MKIDASPEREKRKENHDDDERKPKKARDECGDEPMISEVTSTDSDRITHLIAEVNAEAAERDREQGNRPVAEEKEPIDEIARGVGDWKTYYDTVTGVELNRDLVREAQTDELKAMEEMMVWRKLGPGEYPNQPVVPTKWGSPTRATAIIWMSEHVWLLAK